MTSTVPQHEHDLEIELPNISSPFITSNEAGATAPQKVKMFVMNAIFNSIYLMRSLRGETVTRKT